MISVCSVRKIEWEFGESFGHVFYPLNIAELHNKIQELDRWGKEQQFPFLVAIDFYDETVYLGFLVGHDYSLIEFTYDIVPGHRRGPCYLVNPLGHADECIVCNYFGSHTEPATTKMLPQAQVFAAVFHFIQHHTFPATIRLDDEEAQQRFVLPVTPSLCAKLLLDRSEPETRCKPGR